MAREKRKIGKELPVLHVYQRRKKGAEPGTKFAALGDEETSMMEVATKVEKKEEFVTTTYLQRKDHVYDTRKILKLKIIPPAQDGSLKMEEKVNAGGKKTGKVSVQVKDFCQEQEDLREQVAAAALISLSSKVVSFTRPQQGRDCSRRRN
ncbi:hypothetical protein R1flu_000659 [Riccia fluitans]|uniref:Uncharacterized protein n=1 Tax=Riccia fluitans TaxID=41844 RepID=A0ABD1Y204_9MARC